MPDGTYRQFSLSNDFVCGVHGAARNMRGGKKYLRVSERRTANPQIEEQVSEMTG